MNRPTLLVLAAAALLGLLLLLRRRSGRRPPEEREPVQPPALPEAPATVESPRAAEETAVTTEAAPEEEPVQAPAVTATAAAPVAAEPAVAPEAPPPQAEPAAPDRRQEPAPAEIMGPVAPAVTAPAAAAELPVAPEPVAPVAPPESGPAACATRLHRLEERLRARLDGAIADGDDPQRDRLQRALVLLNDRLVHLAELLPAGGTLVAVEPDRRRYGLLRENFARLGLGGSVDALRTDLAQFAATLPAPFDAILIDAPCSGTGVIRRQPDIRWNRQPEDLETYQRDQLQLLAISARLLKPGGVLVYATCSLEPEENEQTVARFRERHPDFTIDPAGPLLPEAARRLVDADGCFHPTPADGLDGFFAARLRHRPACRLPGQCL